MKLSFNVTLELSVLECCTLTDDDVKAYRNALNKAVAYQMQCCGLTPDELSDKDMGVTGFSIEDARYLTKI